MLANLVIQFFTSLRLTVACLVGALVLVFFGTLAQVELGLWEAQTKYFQSFFVTWTPKGTQLNIPVWPGGYLLGGVLLINLIAAHVKRFTFTKKKLGLFLIHAGLILLLLGQLFTDFLSVESAVRLGVGETKNYSEAFRDNELVVIDKSNPEKDRVISIPESVLNHRKLIEHETLPFQLRVRHYWRNSDITMQQTPGALPSEATQGIGRGAFVIPAPPVTSMDQRNLPTALVEVVTPEGTLGSWLVSSMIGRDQSFTYQDKQYQVALRFLRHYTDHSITLLECRHDLYTGTSIPKNFSSRVRLRNPISKEDREILIYMNNPLRYAGLTYYQYQMGEGGPDGRASHSTLQVVRNPSWLTPYLACTMVGAGLLIQFLMHLIGFAKRSGKAQTGATGPRYGQPAPAPARKPAGAGAAAPAPAQTAPLPVSVKRKSV